jgi:inhibitor of KinA
LIGRTPVRIFDPDATQPTLLKPGDLVEFREIDRATFDATVNR